MIFSCDVELYDEPKESMVIATPFNKKKHFYYNQKINCIRASGNATSWWKKYFFNGNDSFAVFRLG